jgi:hypothetical protein
MYYYVLYKVFVLVFRVLAYIIFTLYQILHFSAKSTKPAQNRQL